MTEIRFELIDINSGNTVRHYEAVELSKAFDLLRKDSSLILIEWIDGEADKVYARTRRGKIFEC